MSNKVNTTETIFKGAEKTSAEVVREATKETKKVVDEAIGKRVPFMIPMQLQGYLGAVNGIYTFSVNGTQYAVRVDSVTHEIPEAAAEHMAKVLSVLDKRAEIPII